MFQECNLCPQSTVYVIRCPGLCRSQEYSLYPQEFMSQECSLVPRVLSSVYVPRQFMSPEYSLSTPEYSLLPS